MSLSDSEFHSHTAHIDQLVRRVESLPDEQARNTALELLQAMMDLHGAAFARIVELLGEEQSTGPSALRSLSTDPLLCGLMVLYGVHPMPLEERVGRAFEATLPQIRKQGGTAELLSISDTAVHLRVQSSGHGCHSSPDALKSMLQQSILEAAPELSEIVVEGAPTGGFVPLSVIKSSSDQEQNYEESAA